MMQKANFDFIEKMSVNDVKDVAEIQRECFSDPWSEKQLTESLDIPGYNMIVYKKYNLVLGHAIMYFCHKEGYIYSIAVKTAFRGLGIGKSLLKNLILFSESHNLNFLSLEVRNSNSIAIKMYESLDFKRQGIRKNFYKIPTEDAIIMTKFFDIYFKL